MQIASLSNFSPLKKGTDHIDILNTNIQPPPMCTSEIVNLLLLIYWSKPKRHRTRKRHALEDMFKTILLCLDKFVKTNSDYGWQNNIFNFKYWLPFSILELFQNLWRFYFEEPYPFWRTFTLIFIEIGRQLQFLTFYQNNRTRALWKM